MSMSSAVAGDPVERGQAVSMDSGEVKLTKGLGETPFGVVAHGGDEGDIVAVVTGSDCEAEFIAEEAIAAGDFLVVADDGKFAKLDFSSLDPESVVWVAGQCTIPTGASLRGRMRFRPFILTIPAEST